MTGEIERRNNEQVALQAMINYRATAGQPVALKPVPTPAITAQETAYLTIADSYKLMIKILQDKK